MATKPWGKKRGSAPKGDPTTVAGFLNRVVSDWDTTLRFIAIISCALFFGAAGIAFGIGVLIKATEGIWGISPRAALPIGLFCGAPLVTLITTITSGLIRRRRARGASDNKTSSTK
jgi:K+ transporter